MKSGLRSAAVALLLLAGVIGVCESAAAQTVIWSVTLTAGTSGARVGFGPPTLHIGDHSYSASSEVASFSTSAVVIFAELLTADETYSLSITTPEPGAPQSVTAMGAPNSVTLNWAAPSSVGGSAIAGYKYRHKASGDAEFEWTAIPNSAGLTNFAVMGLQASTEYTFQMLATNDSGDGDYSEEVTASTFALQPVATLTLTPDAILEDGGTSTVTATLDRASSAASCEVAGDFTLTGTAGDAERLWSARDARGLVRNDDFEARSRLETELGYGITGPYRLGVITPFAGLGLSEGGGRRWRSGARWQVSGATTVNLDGTRREKSHGDIDNAVMLGARMRF